MEKKQIKEMVNMVDVIKGVSFVSLIYTNSHGERSKYVVNVGIKHNRVLERDLTKILELRTSLFPTLSEKYGEKVTLAAFDEMEKSVVKSLEGTNDRAQAQIDAYVHINAGIKLNLESRDLHLYGYLVSKKVLEKGEYKPVKSQTKTLCKNEIKKHLKSGKYRQFKFDGTECFTTGGNTLTIEYSDM